VTDVRSVRRLTLAVAATVVVLDAITKALAVQFLTGRGTVSVLGGALRLQLYRNFAGPRNTFEGHPVLVSLMAVAAVAAIAVMATRVRTPAAALAVGSCSAADSETSWIGCSARPGPCEAAWSTG